MNEQLQTATDLELEVVFDLQDVHESRFRVQWLREQANFAPGCNIHKCARCGANLRYTGIFVDANGFHYAIGRECAGHLESGLAERIERVKMETQRNELASRTPGLKRLWEIAQEGEERWNDFGPYWHSAWKGYLSEFGFELAFKSWDYPKKFSDKQGVWVQKVVDEAEAKKAAFESSGPAHPVGRVVVEGIVTSLKRYDDRFGTTYKMLLQCEGYKVWVSVPSAMPNPAKGDTVKVKATLEGSDKDRTFAIGKRPVAV